MERLDTEMVDAALHDIDEREAELKDVQHVIGGTYAPAVAAAEVRALRNELDLAQTLLKHADLEIEGLREQLLAAQTFAKAQDNSIARLREKLDLLAALGEEP